jgi:hypothetical protein
MYNVAADHQLYMLTPRQPGLIPTVILGGNDSFHFAFHPEKDGNVRIVIA